MSNILLDKAYLTAIWLETFFYGQPVFLSLRLLGSHLLAKQGPISFFSGYASSF